MSFSIDWPISIDPFDLVLRITNPHMLDYVMFVYCYLLFVWYLFAGYLFAIWLIICDLFVQKPCAHFEMYGQWRCRNTDISPRLIAREQFGRRAPPRR